jgi:hypothetical protein
LEVGDLNDIAIITTPKEFNVQLELKLPDGRSTPVKTTKVTTI